MSERQNDRDRNDRFARFNALAPFKFWRATEPTDEAAQAAIIAVEKHAILTENHATAMAVDRDFWRGEYDRLALEFHLQATLLELNGWEFDETARCYKPPRKRMDGKCIDLRDIDPFASIESPQALADERRERLDSGYSSGVVDAVRK